MPIRILFFLTLLGAQISLSQTPSKIKLEEELQRERMINMTRQLGVTCNTCHNSKDFTSDKKIAYKIALEHIRLTQLLIDNGMDGKNSRPKADCYMCHRGQAKPDYKEPFDPLIMKKPNQKNKKSSVAEEEEDDAHSGIQLTH